MPTEVKPELKVNRSENKLMLYYIYFEASTKEKLLNFYEYLRKLEDLTSVQEKTVMQVIVSTPVEGVPSLLGCAFKVNDPEFKWYGMDKINNSHHIIKLKSTKIDIYDFEDLVHNVKLFYEDEDILIVNYNFAINS